MKKCLYTFTTFLVLVTLSISATVTSAFAWSLSFHAHGAKKCLGLRHKYIASYNARMGSTVPDFFWYLRDTGLIDPDTADMLHGDTEQTCVVLGDTTYFYEVVLDNLNPYDYGLRYFSEGIKTHVYADIKSHNHVDGYVEGANMWVDTLQSKTGVPDREALHLAAEFAADSLLVDKYCLQLADLFPGYRQLNLLQAAVEQAFEENGLILDFDVRKEFYKYLLLVKELEIAAKTYASYLIPGQPEKGFSSILESSGLLRAEQELSEESFELYIRVLMILLIYPNEIYETLTAEGMHWEDNALRDVILFCKDSDICPVGLR